MKMINKFTLGSRYYFQKLNEEEKNIYRKIYDEWILGKSEVSITFKNKGFNTSSGKTIHDIVGYILYENPHIFHLETKQFKYSKRGDQVIISAESIYSQNEYEKILGSLLITTERIVNSVKNIKTKEEKLRLLHDYLSQTIVYYEGGQSTKSRREVHTIVGALLNKACVCDGYAKALRLLCDQLRISSMVVAGDSIEDGERGPHAWNIVKINKRTYHIDVTWDSILSQTVGKTVDYYYMRSDKDFLSTHDWDKSFYPKCNYEIPRKYPILYNKKEMEHYILIGIKNIEKRITLCLNGDFPNYERLKFLIKKIIDNNKELFQKVKSYSYTYDDRMKTIKYVELEIKYCNKGE